MSAAKSRKVRLPSGVVVEVYTISALANALERSTLTIRRWEKLGIIPDTFFTDNRGFRMYSQEQIDIIVSCAREAGIKKGLPLVSTDFSVLCHFRLKDLREKYLKGGK